MTFEELRKKSVSELRDIAKDLKHEAVQGYTQLNKEHLLPAVCKALGIDAHPHHHIEEAFNKGDIKARMRRLRAERDKALEAHDSTKLKLLRHELHALNHRIRAHTA
jgi:hypothetical protein